MAVLTAEVPLLIGDLQPYSRPGSPALPHQSRRPRDALVIVPRPASRIENTRPRRQSPVVWFSIRSPIIVHESLENAAVKSRCTHGAPVRAVPRRHRCGGVGIRS
eukprot:scaffold1086_cov397-Prasinococcus_capsulatus_cf.AAC.10